ncbi:hypothetical protein ACUVJI_04700 [Vibrio parahaemolyticus]|uniref:hypothetical protein n=1 Tax=Vibrio parahaemolyticus TaxID=670 RepID=UPI00070FBB98|nr:hypothetical protein [Vibrio parahaemolyticus]ALM66753.1 hypothetical protein FORC4_1780 [Vibrio parahaemolyticus]MCC3859489.1 hypothetical protein [Vibrio parahaemolyticus]MCI9687499.1 hypothetical protein [Vibrio parahaemolyticus]
MFDLNNVAAGIVAGLVTGVLIWFFRAIWLSILKPRIEDLLYKGVRIDGLWFSELVGAESTHKEEIVVVQRGNKISGTIKTVEGQDKGSNYKFTGSFKNLVLTGTYESTSKYMTDRGTFILRLSDNGGELKGITTYAISAGSSLCTVEYVWSSQINF